eukprot:gb/GECG01003028.1/.p1 GENE.gb/GECG01003028.1/~~gb/GECG01003028.1/.p1  ORF type:complete len:458 (+),score=19.94 gb/GECG01003028.1/:1-1374(+)
MELQGDWSYEELSDTTKMAARQTPVLHKSGKKYTAIADGDGRSSEAVNPQDGSVGPTTCCCGLCIVKRYQAFSSPLLLFIIGSMALSPLAITPHLSENEWKSTTALHSILGIACLALLVCTTFIEPGVLPRNTFDEPIIPKTKEYSDLLPFRTIARADAEVEVPPVLGSDTPSLISPSTTRIWTMHQNEAYRNWHQNYRYWAIRRNKYSQFEAVYNMQQRLISHEACSTGGSTTSEMIHLEDIFPLRICSVCNLIIYPQVVHMQSKLGHCVNGFDHYCRWAGSVIGHRNYAAYASFLFSLWLFTGSGVVFSGLVLDCLVKGSDSRNDLKVAFGMRQQYHLIALGICGLLHLVIFSYVCKWSCLALKLANRTFPLSAAAFVGTVHLYLQAKKLTQSQHMSLDQFRKKFSQARFAFRIGHSFIQGYNEGDYLYCSQIPSIVLERTTSAQYLQDQLNDAC